MRLGAGANTGTSTVTALLARLRRPAMIAALAVLPALVASLPAYDSAREQAFDAVLSWTRAPTPPADTPTVVVVDIDRASIAAHGGWPWRRELLAELVARIAAAKPKAVGIDVLLAEPDQRSPAALARALAAATGEPARDGADRLLDGDRALATAIGATPTILAAALGPEPVENAHPPPSAPVLVNGRPRLPGLWTAPVAIGPTERLAEPVAGIGIVALHGDRDGRIRRLPLLAGAGDRLMPGFAADVARVADEASVFVLSGDGLAVGGRTLPLGTDAMLRLRPSSETARQRRTLSAATLLSSDGRFAADRLAGRAVLLGSSAAEAGGLRLAEGGDLVAAIQMQADGVTQILAGDAPSRHAGLAIAEAIAAALAALLAAWAGWRLAPARGLLAVTVAALVWPALAFAAATARNVLVDPLLVPATAVAVYAVAALANAARTWAREARLRARFAQHVSPEVVARLAADPTLARLDGEMRTVTVLVTDIEGFTGLVERSEPRALVALLDRYVDGMSEIVVRHGGMVDKIVGDSVIALFNAPLDLAAHERAALSCATDMQAFTTGLAAEAEARSAGLGRTRIGIETGRLIVGDVGRGAKIDYTAYGDAINTAARLEAANKELGSAICIGETAAAGMPPEALRPLGRLKPRGRTREIAVYEPWPADWPQGDRDTLVAVHAGLPGGSAEARARLADLAARHPGDAVLTRLAQAGPTD